MQKTKNYYDYFYTTHDVSVNSHPVRFSTVSDLLHGKVLDVACGFGPLADYYNGDYVGVDISDVAIKKAQEIRRKTARFLQADFAKDVFTVKEKFDSAYLGEFLEHIENDDIVFDNLLRVCSPNARLVFTVPNGERIKDESHCRIFTVPQIRKDYSKYGKITFHNWSGFNERILFTIDLGQENENLLSLVMIAKNEEKGIENAILSCINIVDHIVISIDSKSTDETAKIADLYADELRTHEWQDHFANTRNEAQQNVKTPWILFLDGHEYIENTGQFKMHLLLDVDGLMTTIKMENGTSFMYPRIFKSHLKFENAVHNAIDCKTTYHIPKFVIVHDRFNSQSVQSIKDREKQRDRMIPKFMKENLLKNPKDQRSLFNLANWYMTKSVYKEALKFYKLCYKFTPSPDEKYFVMAQIGICHQMLNHNIRAFWSFNTLEQLIPNRWETRRLLGGLYLAEENYRKAVIFLTDALEPNKQQYLYQLFGQNYSELWDLISCSYVGLNRPAEAVVALEESIKNTTEKARIEFLKTRLGFVKMLLRQRV